MRLSVSELTTLHVPFDEELELFSSLGVEGIGIFEPKLPEGRDAESVRKLQDSGLQATVCIPGLLSILPLPDFEGPSDPRQRVDALCAGIRRLAAFRPVTTMCLTGPRGSLEEAKAREIVVDGLRRIARAADEVDVPVGVEPIHASVRDRFTLVSTIPEAVELIEEVGEPNLGIMFDTWHHWDVPNLLDEIRREAHRFVPAIHVDDWRDPTRGWSDRAVPGEGIIDLPGIFGALEAAGWDGWADVEIFSDDGTLVTDYPDSLWRVEPRELVRRSQEGVERAWQRRTVPA
jgi:sugar phosphate isomerase/epimerase